jgi:hypothetical protein
MKGAVVAASRLAVGDIGRPRGGTFVEGWGLQARSEIFSEKPKMTRHENRARRADLLVG